MVFRETKLKGAFIIDIEPREDERGFFARSLCGNEFSAQGLNASMVQMNLGFSHRKGTLRGMHFQTPPFAEVKLIRCTRGTIYDVIIDVRPQSPTHAQWYGVELSDQNRRMVYAPEGFAHGYITLADDTEMVYQTTQFFSKDHATGVRYNDPAFHIDWPFPAEVISEQDGNWPDYRA
jgi:dTDP-4-dehydrorhamnose 3,5-epimerase